MLGHRPAAPTGWPASLGLSVLICERKYCLGVINTPSMFAHALFLGSACIFNQFSEVGQLSARLTEPRGLETKSAARRLCLESLPRWLPTPLTFWTVTFSNLGLFSNSS